MISTKRELASAIDARIASVDRALSDAEASWSSWRSRLLAREESSQVLGSLRSIRASLDSWRALGLRLKDSGLADGGQARLDQWTRDANDHLLNIRGIAEDVRTVGVDRIILQTATATAKAVALAPVAAISAAGSVAGAAWSARRWLLFLAVAAVVAVVAFKARVLRAVVA